MNASRAAILALVLPLAFSLTTPADAAQGPQSKGSMSDTTVHLSIHSILPMQIRLPNRVRVIVDGRSRIFKTTALTVSDVIKEARIVLGSRDLVNTPLPTQIFEGLQIRVTRIQEVSSIKQVKIPYVVKKILDRKMLVGKRILKSRGVAGLAEVRSVNTFADGKVVKTRIISRVTIKQAHAAQVVVGTRLRTIDELNWAAVAQCESRGNPRSSNSANGYFGMFQFTLTAWKTAGGVGNPMDYSAAEQLMRAKRLYKIRGWHAWPVCGRLFTS